MRTLVLFLLAACGGSSMPTVDPDANVTIDGNPEVDAQGPPVAATLAMGEASPSAIAVYGGEVFWTTDPAANVGAVRKLAPGSGPSTLAGQEDQPRTLAVGMGFQEPTAYWGTANLLGQVKQIATTGAPPLSSVAINNVVYAITLDGDAVFVGTRSAVLRKGLPNAGGLTTLASGYANGVTAIAADATGVVFGARQVNDTWIIATVARTGGTVTTIAAGSVVVRDIAIVGPNVFWLERNLLRKVSRTGGQVQTVRVFEGETPWALVASQGKLFVATNSGVINPSGAKGRILELDSATPAEREIAKDQPEPIDVFVTATHIYWANRGLTANTGSIMRIAR